MATIPHLPAPAQANGPYDKRMGQTDEDDKHTAVSHCDSEPGSGDEIDDRSSGEESEETRVVAHITDPGPADARPRILLVSLGFRSTHTEYWEGLLKRLNASAVVHRAVTPRTAKGLMRKLKPRAIIITDLGVLQPENAAVVDSLFSYARKGGIVVMGMVCNTDSSRAQMEFLFERFDLPWCIREGSNGMFLLNTDALQGIHIDKFPEDIFSQGSLIVNMDPENALYYPRAEMVRKGMRAICSPSVDDELRDTGSSMIPIEPDTSPAGWAKIGQGRLGFIGDGYGGGDITRLYLAMCGLP